MVRRVLVISPTINISGIAAVVMSIFRQLKDEKDLVFDFVCFEEPLEERIKEIECRGGEVFLLDRLQKSGLIKYSADLGHILKMKKYDFIHIHTALLIWVSARVARQNKIPVIIGHAHGHSMKTKNVFVRLGIPLFRRLNHHYCTKMITCCNESGVYTFGRDYSFMPNFITKDEIEAVRKINSADLKKQLNCNNESKILFSAGRLDGNKHVDRLIKVFSEVKGNNYLLLAGDAKNSESLASIKKLASDLMIDERVIFLGYRQDIDQFYALADVYVTTSSEEGMSMSLVQSQMLGIPTVFGNIPPENDINIGLAYYVNGLDSSLWVNAIEKAIESQKVTGLELDERIRKASMDMNSINNRLKDLYSIV